MALFVSLVAGMGLNIVVAEVFIFERQTLTRGCVWRDRLLVLFAFDRLSDLVSSPSFLNFQDGISHGFGILKGLFGGCIL